MAVDIKKLESQLWESADLLRSGSKLTSNQYCMPVLGLIFLRYAFSRFKRVEAEILSNRPMRGGRQMPVEAADFKAKSAIYLPCEAQFDYLVNLPVDVTSMELKDVEGHTMNSLGEVVNNAMELIEQQTPALNGVLPKDYTVFANDLLKDLLRIFNNDALDDVGGDVIGRIYEYFLSKFSKAVAQDDGVFFTPKSLVKMIVNVLEPKSGILLDPACGSGGMFVQTGDFVNAEEGMGANSKMTFYGQEKVEFNARLCQMNMAVHGLAGTVKSGDEANTFYKDAHNLVGCCDYVMANPPFNVDKVKAVETEEAGRLPFGMPAVNKAKEVGNANYLWISYFYAYLNERGRAGFVMASSATDSSGKDREIREKLVSTGDVDVMVSVGNNFFYTLSLPCSLWFFNRGKSEELKDKVLFIDTRNYYTVVDRTLNEWNEWQLRNLNAIVWLYRGETERYKGLISLYKQTFGWFADAHDSTVFQQNDWDFEKAKDACETYKAAIDKSKKDLEAEYKKTRKRDEKLEIKAQIADVDQTLAETNDIITAMTEAVWLTSKFGEDGVYQDIAGLCKIASREEIAEKNYTLTPGAYVGVAEVEDDGVEFAPRMREIHDELAKLNSEANDLMDDILKNLDELGV